MRITTVVITLLVSLNLLAQEPASKTRMAIPGVKGVLEIDVGPATIETRVRPDGKEVQLQAFNRPDYLTISAFLQKVEFPASPEKCRDEWWTAAEKATPMQRDNLQQSVKDGIARVEYIISEFQGAKVQQKNLHGYLGSRDLCAEIHISRGGFKPDDQKLFEQVLESVKLLPDESGVAPAAQAQSGFPASASYFAQGSEFYLQGNYSVAAEYYQKALDLEKQNRTFSQDKFRVLIDNLGMSYGISRKLPEAKQIFEYGLTRDPGYPLFYYNLACTYGEMGKMDEAIGELRQAYRYRSNMILGETFPDPLKDDSFRNFVNNGKFVSAVVEMQKH